MGNNVVFLMKGLIPQSGLLFSPLCAVMKGVERVMTKEDLFDVKFFYRSLGARGQLLYQVGREPLTHISNMSLELFESLFTQEEITSGKLDHLLGKIYGADCIFNSDIERAYGVNGSKQFYTTNYVPGTIVRSENGIRYAYLGKVKEFTVSYNNAEVLKIDAPRHIYFPIGDSENFLGLKCKEVVQKFNEYLENNSWVLFNNYALADKMAASVCTDSVGISFGGIDNPSVIPAMVCGSPAMYVVSWKEV